MVLRLKRYSAVITIAASKQITRLRLSKHGFDALACDRDRFTNVALVGMLPVVVTWPK